MVFELNYDMNNFYVKLKKDGKEMKLCKEEKDIGCEISDFKVLYE